ncbi:hypothetical protein B4U79_01681 [Dinothrombium tinctorium]|uniref:Uncharacterized protein n=1 Tax=Dinothrombium tinctorium TaxID=1965070 RepID=A0A3S3NU91_9ACAR|nr:hypothetical protein B4U79_01681 [Dinothrombium tinctorium]
MIRWIDLPDHVISQLLICHQAIFNWKSKKRTRKRLRL